jgi:hypothetical protein
MQRLARLAFAEPPPMVAIATGLQWQRYKKYFEKTTFKNFITDLFQSPSLVISTLPPCHLD